NKPGGGAKQHRLTGVVDAQQRSALRAEQNIDHAGLQQMDAVQAEPARRDCTALHPDRDDVDIEQHGEVRRHGLQQLLEAGGAGLLPRPGKEGRTLSVESGAAGDHPMSLAMPDSPANSGESEHALAGRKVRVMLPLPLPEPLDYLLPEGAAVPEAGSFVRVTLGSRRV